jgi:hypothetical protein
MKRRITIKHRHASSVRSDLSEYLFTRFPQEGYALLLSFCTDFAAWVTVSGKRGAEGHPAAVVRVVVVITTIVVDISEVIVVVGRAQPPPGGRASYST